MIVKLATDVRFDS